MISDFRPSKKVIVSMAFITNRKVNLKSISGPLFRSLGKCIHLYVIVNIPPPKFIFVM